MSSPCRKYFIFFSLVVMAVFQFPARAQQRELRVCADPDNLPFSNNQQQGFENLIATLVAQDLQANLSYVWQRMGRGFVREYLNQPRCDLLIGVPDNYQPLLTTTPYYRSSYVFVIRRDAPFKPTSLDDPALRKIKIGVQALNEQYTPPAEALIDRGLQSSLVPFYSVGGEAESIVRAVLNREISAAIVWGPLAGYWATKFPGDLELTPVPPENSPSGLPFTFAISMGVRKGNDVLRQELEAVLQHRQQEIQEILSQFGIPTLPAPAPSKRGR
jgi:mxaJ protein